MLKGTQNVSDTNRKQECGTHYFNLQIRLSVGILFIVHNVSGVMVQYLFAQCTYVYMGVYLCRPDALVPQHLLNGTQIGTAFQQFGSKRMAQSVRTDGFTNAGCLGLTLDHDEYHLSLIHI